MYFKIFYNLRYDQLCYFGIFFSTFFKMYDYAIYTGM